MKAYRLRIDQCGRDVVSDILALQVGFDAFVMAGERYTDGGGWPKGKYLVVCPECTEDHIEQLYVIWFIKLEGVAGENTCLQNESYMRNVIGFDDEDYVFVCSDELPKRAG